jgi:deoxyribose-phosphate aldolase
VTSTLTLEDVDYERLAHTIDHSLLKPELTVADVHAGCELAARYGVASVCVRPADVPRSVTALRGTAVGVGTVVGFPHGANATATKVFEAQRALEEGATELDMVLNLGLLRSGEHAAVEADIAAVVAAARNRAIVKVILENAYLDDEEKVRGCQLAESAGADFVKTSTGFASSGATNEDLTLMRATVSQKVQVKAAGGVRSLDRLLEVMALGVTRIGATQTSAILDEYRRRTTAGSPA